MSRQRFFKSSFVYPDYIRRFYQDRPCQSAATFAQQMEALLADGFSFGDAWKHYLEASGRYEVMEVVANAEAAQKRWAREHGLRYAEENWSQAILAAQLADFKPDIWFCHGLLASEHRLRLRQQCPTISYVIGYDGILAHDPKHLAGCDAVLCCVKESAAFYTRAGFRGYWLPWGFDPRLLGRLQPGQGRYQLSFCGSMHLNRNRGHFERPRLLARLQRDFDIAVFCGDLSGRKIERWLLSHIYRRKVGLACQTLQVYPAVRRLRRSNRGERFGLAMLQTLADSEVALNVHGSGINTAANIRLFETTGAGACLLTDWKEDLPSVFEPDREVAAFRSPEECAEKLRYLIDHQKVRRTIAAAGQARCLRDHNIGNHILAFADEVLNKL